MKLKHINTLLKTAVLTAVVTAASTVMANASKISVDTAKGDGPTVSRNMMTGHAQINSLMTAYSGWLIGLDSVDNNPHNCSKGKFYLSSTHSQQQQIFSVLIAANVSNKKVQFYTSGCTEHGYNNVSQIRVLWGS